MEQIEILTEGIEEKEEYKEIIKTVLKQRRRIGKTYKHNNNINKPGIYKKHK